MSSHTVKSGDTLWDISVRYLGDGNRWREIQSLNNISGEMIYPEQVLRLPNSSTSSTATTNTSHTVQSGDTLWDIAVRYLNDGNRWREIQALNNIQGEMIYPGQVIRLPGSTSSSSSSASNTSHTVQSGDTLWQISVRYLGDGNRWREIQSLNNISGEMIYPGQVLRLPSSSSSSSSSTSPSNTSHTVQSGDTLWQISVRYLGDGNRWREIQSLNNLTSEMIYPGQVLRLPK